MRFFFFTLSSLSLNDFSLSPSLSFFLSLSLPSFSLSLPSLSQSHLYDIVSPTIRHDLDKAAEKVHSLKAQIAEVKSELNSKKSKREEKDSVSMTEEEYLSTLSRGIRGRG